MRTKLRSKFTLLFIVCAALLAFAGTAMALTTDTSGNTAPAPTIQSDKADYAPGELVTLTGSGWQSGESVNIVVNDDEGQTWNRNVNVIADESGSIRDSFNLPDWFVAAYSVTATGSSGTATTSFTDARVVTTATLNGGNSVNVQAGSSMNANVSVTTDGSGANARWRSTGWRIATTAPNATSDVTCVNTPNHDSAGTNNESFSINAPNAAGTYNAYFIAFSDDACTWAPSGGAGQSNTFTLTNGVVATPTTQTLTVTKDGTGTGTVTSSPTGINCGTTCSANFNNGASVTLTANAGPNSTFDPQTGWSGGSGTVNANGTYTVSMTEARSVTATFVVITHQLSVTKDGAGTVTSDPPGINCGTDCSENYVQGTSVTLTAAPGANSTFNGWSGGSGTTNADGTYTVSMNQARSVNATFKANQTITFAQPTSPQTFGETFNVNPSASSGLGVTVQASGGCSIQAVQSGYDVTMTSGTTSCVLTASQGGNGNYNAATPVEHTVAAQKASQTITFNTLSNKTYGDEPFDLSANGGASGNPVTFALGTDSKGCSLSGTNNKTVTITGATAVGEKCIIVASQAGNANYLDAASVTRDFTIAKANQTITFGTITNKIVPATFTVSATASSGLPVSFSAGPIGTCTITGTNVSVTGVGACTITASQAGDSNYNAATSVPQSFNASYTFFGWLQPVDGDGSATGLVNMGKVGRTYPIKWQLKDSTGALISDTAAQNLVSSMSGAAKKADCATFAGSDALEEYTAGNTVLRYDATSDQFIYNYKAPSSPVCQAFVVSKADGVNDKQANFNFTK